ncbi:LysR family transcriptional regulator [Kytococcus sp. Marseille-QA3725]
MLDRRVELLRVLAQVGTITEAAHLLYRSPSGYSRQLRGLADELGVELLEHHGREVRLTAAGRQVLAYAEETHAAWEVTKASLAQDTTVAGTLRLGAHPTALSALVVPHLDELARLHPGVTLQLVEVEAPSCFDQLIAGRLDACIVPARAEVPSVRDRRFHQIPLADEPIDALLPSRHREAASRQISLEELRDDPWILPGPDRSGHQEIVSACHGAGFTPEGVHFAQDTQAVADLVEATGGVSLTSRYATYRSSAVSVPLSGSPVPSRRLLLCVPRGAETRQPFQDLAQLVAAGSTSGAVGSSEAGAVEPPSPAG